MYLIFREGIDEGGTCQKGLSRLILLFSFALFFIVFFLPQFISLYVDWLWFKDVKFEKIFTTKLNAQVIAAFAGGLAGFVISYISIWISLQATRDRALVPSFYNQATPQLDILKHFDRVKIIVPIVIELFVGLLLNNNWATFLYYLNAADSGYSDPIFGKDVSFYLFTLPVFEIISSVMLLILVVSLVISAFSR